MKYVKIAFGLYILAGVALACSSGSTGGGGHTDGGDSSSVSVASMTFSCTVAASGYCTQLLIPSSGSTLASEQSNCKILGGTSGSGCSASGIIDCCKPSAKDSSQEEECYYQAASSELSFYQEACTGKGLTWSTTM
jgi:hypothetical protein